MSAVTASILVGSKGRGDLGVQPRWLVLLHEAQGHAWHLVRLHLSAADVAAAPKSAVLHKGPPGTRPGLDSPPGILWRSDLGADVVGELALLLHLYAQQTPEVLAPVATLETLGARTVDLTAFEGRQIGDYGNALRIARETPGRLYLAVSVIAGSRLDPDRLRGLPGWEINLSRTVWSRDWSSVDGNHLETTDYLERSPHEVPGGLGASRLRLRPSIGDRLSGPVAGPEDTPAAQAGEEAEAGQDPVSAVSSQNDQAAASRHRGGGWWRRLAGRGDVQGPTVRAARSAVHAQRSAAAAVARERSGDGHRASGGDETWLDDIFDG